jgi:flagellar biosynthesis/type III secretory pathway M-ring protein FliF/YscJ
MLKTIIHHSYKILSLGIFVCVIVWSISLIKTEVQQYIDHTPEMKYESALTKKSVAALKILIPSEQFKIITTVRFRNTIETFSQVTKDPQITNTQSYSSQKKQHNKNNEFQNVVTQVTPVSLPGMKELISETKKYKLVNSTPNASHYAQSVELEHQNQNVYFNHSQSNVAYKDHVVTFIRLFVIIDPDVLPQFNLTENEIRRHLKDTVPFNFTRGDKLIIKLHAVAPPLSFIDKLTAFSTRTYMLMGLYFSAIKLPLLILILFSGILLLAKYLINRQESRLNSASTKEDPIKDNIEGTPQDTRLNKHQLFSNDQRTPEFYQKEIKSLIHERTEEVAQILQNWLISNNR